MKKIINKISHTKKRTIILIVICLCILTTLGITYGYFQLGLHAEQITTIEVSIEQMEKFTYTSGDALVVNNSNITSSTTPKVTLIPGTDEILISSTYDVYFQATNNTFMYTTLSKGAELLLSITDPAGNVITEAEGLNYVSSGGVSGFDITEFWGFTPISINYPISSQDMVNGTTQSWTATVTFVDLLEEQIVPEGTIREFEGVLLLKNGETNGLNEVLLDADGGIEYIESKPNPTYASGEYIYAGLHAAQDDYGTTYYYRGASVSNNFVEFSGYLWEIIRINGDGSIRLLYAEDTAIGTSVYNSFGYGYGISFGYTYTPNVSYGNELNSSVKSVVDNWYSLDTNIGINERFLTDNVFCNDLSNEFSGLDAYIGGASTTWGDNYVSYGWLRMYRHNSYLRILNKQPSFICPNVKDKYTVNNIIGNQNLTYPVGVISGDELYFSSSQFSNYSAFLSMSPAKLTNGSSDNPRNGSYIILSNLVHHKTNLSSDVRPVINLKGSVLVTGSGTKENPYNVIGDDETPGV